MPALRLLGRRWNVASDDLPIIFVSPTLFHAAWSVILFAGWLALDRPKACTAGRRYTLALAGLGIACVVNFLLGIWIVCESLRGRQVVDEPWCRSETPAPHPATLLLEPAGGNRWLRAGTIFETQKRWKVPWLVHFFFVVAAVELGFLSKGPATLCLSLCAVWHQDGIRARTEVEDGTLLHATAAEPRKSVDVAFGSMACTDMAPIACAYVKPSLLRASSVF